MKCLAIPDTLPHARPSAPNALYFRTPRTRPLPLTQTKSRPLDGRDYKTLGLSALGGALEFYDFIIFVFFATVIGKLFFPEGMPDWLVLIQTFGIFAAGYLVRPIGGIVLAHFGDRFGRKKVFAFSILLMALSTLGMAMMPTYHQHRCRSSRPADRSAHAARCSDRKRGSRSLDLRSRACARPRTGLACGILTSGLSLGILFGSLIATLVNTIFVPEEVASYAWRIPFLLGGIFGLIAVYLPPLAGRDTGLR